jgi:hypothetical protein
MNNKYENFYINCRTPFIPTQGQSDILSAFENDMNLLIVKVRQCGASTTLCILALQQAIESKKLIYICADTNQLSRLLFECIDKLHTAYKGEIPKIKNMTTKEIHFENGSIIKSIGSVSNQRGLKQADIMFIETYDYMFGATSEVDVISGYTRYSKKTIISIEPSSNNWKRQQFVESAIDHDFGVILVDNINIGI